MVDKIITYWQNQLGLDLYDFRTIYSTYIQLSDDICHYEPPKYASIFDENCKKYVLLTHIIMPTPVSRYEKKKCIDYIKNIRFYPSKDEIIIKDDYLSIVRNIINYKNIKDIEMLLNLDPNKLEKEIGDQDKMYNIICSIVDYLFQCKRITTHTSNIDLNNLYTGIIDNAQIKNFINSDWYKKIDPVSKLIFAILDLAIRKNNNTFYVEINNIFSEIFNQPFDIQYDSFPQWFIVRNKKSNFYNRIERIKFIMCYLEFVDQQYYLFVKLSNALTICPDIEYEFYISKYRFQNRYYTQTPQLTLDRLKKYLQLGLQFDKERLRSALSDQHPEILEYCLHNNLITIDESKIYSVMEQNNPKFIKTIIDSDIKLNVQRKVGRKKFNHVGEFLETKRLGRGKHVRNIFAHNKLILLEKALEVEMNCDPNELITRYIENHRS